MSAHYQVDRPANVERFNASHTNVHESSLDFRLTNRVLAQPPVGRFSWPRMKSHPELPDIFIRVTRPFRKLFYPSF